MSALSPSDASTRLFALRQDVENVATEFALAKQRGDPMPGMESVASAVTHLQDLLSQLQGAQRAEADFVVGSGLAMMGRENDALRHLLDASSAPVGDLSVSDHLSAIMQVLPSLRKSRRWLQIIEMTGQARAVGGGKWLHETLPFLAGVAHAGLLEHDTAAALFEDAIQLNPGFRPAYQEFDSAVAALNDSKRARQVAQRLVDHGGFWVNCWQRPPHFLPGLSSAPWHGAENFEITRRLEQSSGAILEELRAAFPLQFTEPSNWGLVGSAARGNERSEHDGALVGAGEWREIVLLGDSDACAENCLRFPETARVLQSLPEVSEAATLRLGESLFSMLTPGTRLRPHCGPTNMRLTCHLGLQIPDGCTIRCGGEARSWEQGKCIVFDDSYEHEVCHDGTESRVVLLVNFWHPDIPPEDRAARMSEVNAPQQGTV